MKCEQCCNGTKTDANLFSLDPLKFKDTKRYTDRIKSAMKKTNLKDAFISGSATVQGKPIHIGAFEFDFLGGSMGSVVGEKIARLYERSLQKNTHVITISCSALILNSDIKSFFISSD